ncbi:MAG: SDR family NAD(P)-dependent oxidoreductase [Nostocoides sp.]
MRADDRFSLAGKVAVVTGASRGLGATFAVALAEAGADVALGARSVDGLEHTKAAIEALGRRAILVPTDVTKAEDCDQLVAQAVEQLGDVHVLVNNAGVSAVVPAHREDPAAFSGIVDVNLIGTFQMSQAFARACIAKEHGGSIISLASVLGLVATDAPQSAYCSTKAAVMGLTRDLALQWTHRRGIRVNAIAPGLVHSDMTAAIEGNPAALEGALRSIPMGRLGNPDELIGALLLLASDAGSYITGSTLIVDGGWTAQ